jgi:hypothetical protein
VAGDVGHAEDLGAREVLREGRRLEPVADVIQVGVAPRRLDPVLVLGRAEQQLVVDHGIVSAVQQPVKGVHLLLCRLGAPVPACLFDAFAVVLMDNDVLRLHVGHVVAFFAQVVEGLLLHRLQMVHDVGELELDVFEDLDEVLAADPFVHELVLLQDVEIDAGMARADAVDLRPGPSALPELHPLGRHIDGQGPLSPDPLEPLADLLVRHLHDQGELLPGAVEFCAHKVLKRVRVDRYVLAHAAVLDHKVEARPRHGTRRDAVHRTGAQKPDAVLREPAFFVPILYVEVFLVGFGIPGEVEVAAVLGLHVEVHHAQHVHERFLPGGCFGARG